MPFGAFAPLPIRLGGNAVEGWTATQHARTAADAVAVKRGAPLAVLTVTINSGVVTVTSYWGQNGAGLANAPSTYGLGFAGVLEWSKAYPSPFYVQGIREDSPAWLVRSVRVCPVGSALQYATAEVQTDGTVKVSLWDNAGAAANGTCTVKVFGDWLPASSVGDYDADPNKEDNLTEASVPYAAQQYRQFQAARGSAYTTKAGTLVHAENLALGRFYGYWACRFPEKVRANSLPNRADEGLAYWQKIYDRPSYPDEPAWSVRARCAAAYQVSGQGPTDPGLRSALKTLLGDVFVDLEYQRPAFSTATSSDYWPAGTHAPDDYDLKAFGGPGWTSARAHIGIKLKQPADENDDAFYQRISSQLYELLNSFLPATNTWDWYTDDGGFYLDVSRLDFDSL